MVALAIDLRLHHDRQQQLHGLSTRRNTRWTAQELRAMALLWPLGGMAACVPHLPRRTPAAIAQRAWLLRMDRTGARSQ